MFSGQDMVEDVGIWLNDGLYRTVLKMPARHPQIVVVQGAAGTELSQGGGRVPYICVDMESLLRRGYEETDRGEVAAVGAMRGLSQLS